MKNIITILFLVFASSFLSAQATIGVRIGSGSSGISVIPKTETTVNVESNEGKIKSYVIFDENENVVLSKEITLTHNATINVSSLKPGLYYITAVSENGEVAVDTYLKP